jgi:hypothetical protein
LQTLDPNPYLGAVIGRVSNRIPGANFTLGGVTYSTSVNDKIPVPGSNRSVATLNDTIHGEAASQCNTMQCCTMISQACFACAPTGWTSICDHGTAFAPRHGD